MISLRETAYGKLNLSLEVLGRRPDGYHELEMVMISVSLSDQLTLSLNTGSPWSVSCDRPGIPAGPENLCWRAAAAYCEAAGLDPGGLSIHIQKNIPAQAGMAGGSSDAAAVLRALNRHYGRFSPEALLKLGLGVGSDVPYCLFGGTALARGRGEVLTRLPGLPGELYFVLAKPEFSVSTPALFREIDEARYGSPGAEQGSFAASLPAGGSLGGDGALPSARSEQAAPEAAGRRGEQPSSPPRSPAAAMIEAITRADRNAIGAALHNDFEPLVAARFPIVEQLRRVMLSHEAEGARLTGTGSVVFGLFCSQFKAAAAALELREHCPEVHLVKAV